MNKQSIVIAVIIAVAIIAGVIIYTQSTRYESHPVGQGMYVTDKATGKTKVVLGSRELEVKKPQEEILTDEQFLKSIKANKQSE